MENAVFYTLSTISQTLAGALALMAAFIVPRIDAFNRVICDSMLEAWREGGFQGERDLGRARWVGDARAVFSMLDRRYKDEAAKDASSAERNARRVAQLWEGLGMIARKESILRSVQRVLLLSVGSIAYCFVGLMLVPEYGRLTLAAAAVVGVGVLLGVMCLMGYVWLLMKALRET